MMVQKKYVPILCLLIMGLFPTQALSTDFSIAWGSADWTNKVDISCSLTRQSQGLELGLLDLQDLQVNFIIDPNFRVGFLWSPAHQGFQGIFTNYVIATNDRLQAEQFLLVGVFFRSFSDASETGFFIKMGLRWDLG